MGECSMRDYKDYAAEADYIHQEEQDSMTEEQANKRHDLLDGKTRRYTVYIISLEDVDDSYYVEVDGELIGFSYYGDMSEVQDTVQCHEQEGWDCFLTSTKEQILTDYPYYTTDVTVEKAA
jgi:hypothetical protein